MAHHHPKLTFLGAASTVTGSKHLLEVQGKKILVDCGLFQGYKQLRTLNWRPLPVRPEDLDAVVLTHAHIDHAGYLPLLVENGFRGPVYCSEGTAELCKILLPDSGYLQEEAADRANRKGYSRHEKAKPLYTADQARASLEYLRPVAFGATTPLADRVGVTLRPAGHIVGAAIATFDIDGQHLVFSGDLGRPEDPVMVPPDTVETADWLVVESTYGDRFHPVIDPEQTLGEIVRRTVARGGVVIIPAFAVGRTQRILYHLHRLTQSGAIDVPVFLNSPLASQATNVFHRCRRSHRLSAAETDAVCSLPRVVSSVEESIALNARRSPAVIIAGSGMATGGRVIHHIRAMGSDPRNTILFTGFQAGGTRGAAMVAGAERVKIFGVYVPIMADVVDLPNLSAHADQAELLAWMDKFTRAPRRTFVVHGAPQAADTLRLRIEEELGWPVDVPLYRDSVTL
jgi:metallo-beta-lactamase family protein